MRSAINLPKMSMNDICPENAIKTFENLVEGNAFIAMGQTTDGRNVAIHSGLNEKLLTTSIVAVNRNIVVFDFMKTVILSVEDYRNNFEEAHQKVIQRVEYFKLKYFSNPNK